MELPALLILCVAGLSSLVGLGCAIAVLIGEARDKKM